MADMARAKRLADRIKVIVAESLELRVKDPRLGFVTVTDVRVTGDLREATVFYTVFGDDAAVQDTAKALASVSGMLRSEVGRLTGVKFTPTLTFQADALPQAARGIDDLLARARAADDEVHRIAADAHYAGDADPYRHDEETDDDADDSAGLEDAGTDADSMDSATSADADPYRHDDETHNADADSTDSNADSLARQTGQAPESRDSQSGNPAA